MDCPVAAGEGIRVNPARHPVWIPILCTALLLIQLVAYVDYFTDDSYIYARFASNLVEHGALVFNVGEPVHAATSPLWAALVAGLIVLGLPLVAGTKILGAACAVAGLWIAWRLARRRFGTGFWSAAFLLLLATEPWFVRWSASGMETPLAILLVLLALESGLRRCAEVAWGRLGWSIGLLPLVRPETLVLWGLVSILALLTPRARRSPVFWTGMVLPMGAWSMGALLFYGTILQATLQAKSTPLGLVPSRLLANLFVLARLYGLALALPTVAWMTGILRKPLRLFRRSESDWLAPVLWSWTAALPAVYLVRDVQVVSRYLEVVLPVVLVLGLSELARLGTGHVLRAGVSVEVLAVLVFSFGWIIPSANAFGRSLQGLTEMGEWLRENTAESTVVAAYDIGAIGYSSRRPILDLGGLVHTGINDLRNEVHDADILHRGLFMDHGNPDYLIDRDPAGPVLTGTRLRGRTCEPVLSRTVNNLGLSRPDPVVYTLYRLGPAAPGS
jgi:hypothetical protein